MLKILSTTATEHGQWTPISPTRAAPNFRTISTLSGCGSPRMCFSVWSRVHGFFQGILRWLFCMCCYRRPEEKDGFSLSLFRRSAGIFNDPRASKEEKVRVFNGYRESFRAWVFKRINAAQDRQVSKVEDLIEMELFKNTIQIMVDISYHQRDYAQVHGTYKRVQSESGGPMAIFKGLPKDLQLGLARSLGIEGVDEKAIEKVKARGVKQKELSQFLWSYLESVKKEIDRNMAYLDRSEEYQRTFERLK